MSNSLETFKDDFATALHGMTKAEAMKEGVCIDCKKPPTFSTEAGKREYPISGLCEPCWDKIFEDTE